MKVYVQWVSMDTKYICTNEFWNYSFKIQLFLK